MEAWMIASRLLLNTVAPIFLLAAFLISTVPVLAAEIEPKVGDDGMYTQAWFKHTSFLDLADDLTEAGEGGKHLAVLFEQKGCPYCREMHRVNFENADIRSYIKKTFDVVQLNLWGDREVTDFDGQVLSEKKFARKYRVMFTPTILFIDEKGEEVVRMPGYFKPFHFKHIFVYAAEKGYVKEPNFQRWLGHKADELRAQGKTINLWD
jgi:thioredoxin-related protein